MLFPCMLFMGGMFRGGNNRGGTFRGRIFRSPINLYTQKVFQSTKKKIRNRFIFQSIAVVCIIAHSKRLRRICFNNWVEFPIHALNTEREYRTRPSLLTERDRIVSLPCYQNHSIQNETESQYRTRPGLHTERDRVSIQNETEFQYRTRPSLSTERERVWILNETESEYWMRPNLNTERDRVLSLYPFRFLDIRI